MLTARPSSSPALTPPTAVPVPSAATSHRRGQAFLDNPYRTKGTAFSEEERAQFGLLGLLPPQVETLEQQVDRAYGAFATRSSALRWARAWRMNSSTSSAWNGPSTRAT